MSFLEKKIDKQRQQRRKVMIDVVKKYLTGVSLVALTFSLNSATAYAEGCPAVPTCAELGYSETDCGEAPALKCPFDQSKLFCGGNCGNGGSNSPTCNVGDIYYSDDTCSPTRINSKTPIGVVYDSVNKLVVSLDESSSGLIWGPNNTDVAQLTNYAGYGPAREDFNGKSNTDILVAIGTQYEAANYCHNKTTGGKTWYLPAYGEILPMFTNYTAVQNTVSAVGTALQYGYLLSTEINLDYAWSISPDYMDSSDGSNAAPKYNAYLVRCVFQYGE
jgi:hypothetical protein